MKFTRKKLQLSVLAALFIPIAVQAASVEERLSNLEDSLMLAEEANEELRAKSESAMKVSGYADAEFITEENNDSRFRIHHLSLFFHKQLDEKWRFFSEIEFEDGPVVDCEGCTGATTAANISANGKIFAEAINLTYQLRPEATLRFGRFFAPAGIWNVDHYPPFVSTQERPQHIRKIFPQLIDGAMAYGTFRMGNTFLNYDAFVGNGEGNNGHNDNNNDKALGLKASFIIPVKGAKLVEVGATAYQDVQNAAEDQKKTATGIHAKVSVSDFTFQTEHATADFSPQHGAAKMGDRSGHYEQLTYSPNQWSFGFRNDFYDSDESTANKGKTIQSLFTNYRFSTNTVGKVEYHQIDAEGSTQKTDKTIFSIVTYLE